MSNFEYQIKYPFLGTPNQQKANILMKFSLDIVFNGTTVVSLNDMTLRKTKDGRMFFSSESREYEKDGQKKYSNYARVFPNPNDREKQDAVTNLVIDQYNKLSSEQGSSPQPSTTQVATAQEPQTASDPW